MGIIETVQKWALREIGEVRRAPLAFILVFVLGGVVGGYLISLFYAERFAVMEQRISSLQASQPKASDASATTSQLAADAAIQTWGSGVPELCQVTISGKRLVQYTGPSGFSVGISQGLRSGNRSRS